MSERSRHPEEPSLFDLPLDPPAKDAPRQRPAERPEERARVNSEADSALPLFEEREDPQPHRVGRHEGFELVSAEAENPADAGEEGEPELPEIAEHPRPEGPLPASLGQRWASGLLDVMLHGALAGLLVLGAWVLGAPVGRDDLIAVGIFLLVFSFLYTVYPLAFWGQTPGMIGVGIVARTGRDGGLTFGQTALRWLGGLLSLATLGIGSFLAVFGGRSLTDRVSGTRTWRLPR